MKPARTVFVITAALLAGALCSCATERESRWEKQGATEDDYYVDQGACSAQAFSVPNAPRAQIVAVFESCLASKGWRRAVQP